MVCSQPLTEIKTTKIQWLIYSSFLKLQPMGKFIRLLYHGQHIKENKRIKMNKERIAIPIKSAVTT